MELPFAMDLFQHRYYRINKIFLKIIGQWPYQTIHIRYTLIAFIFSIVTTQFVPMILAVAKHYDDWELLLECITPIMFGAGCTVRMICGIFNTQKMLKLLDRICADWQVWAGAEEVNILSRYADQGRKRTILFAVMLYSCNILFTIQPVITTIIDLLLMNTSEPREFPFPVNYYHLDMQKYYFYIVMHFFVSVSIGSIIVVAWGGMFIVYVQHCCGIFTALGSRVECDLPVDLNLYKKEHPKPSQNCWGVEPSGAMAGDLYRSFKKHYNVSTETFSHKLEQIGKNERSTESNKAVSALALDKQNMDFKLLVSCIDRHDDAIKYAELIEATYSSCFFFTVGFNMLVISISGVQIVQRSIKLYEALRFVVINTTAMMHLYVESYMSQILMDHSIHIRYNILNIKWYTLSLKAQKLLPLMMMRCNIPCKLTAGKISVMSMSSFGVILKTSLSYFTLLRSI